MKYANRIGAALLALTLMLSGCSALPDKAQETVSADPVSESQSSQEEASELLIAKGAEMGEESEKARKPIEQTELLRLTTLLEAPEADYQIKEVHFQEDLVDIVYPQIEGMADEQLQQAANQILKDAAFDWYYFEEDEDERALHPLTLEISYEIKLSNQSLLSVYFTGFCLYNEMVGEPFCTRNIDLTTGERISFGDFYMFDQAFVDFLLEQPIVNDYTQEHKEAIAKYWIEYQNSYDLDSPHDIHILTRLQNQLDDQDIHDDFTYFTRDAVGFSLYTLHAIGTHVEYEIPYTLLYQ